MIEELNDVQQAQLGMRDLDARYGLQFESVCSRCIDLPGPALRRQFDAKSIRTGGTRDWLMVISYIDIELEPISLTILRELEIAHRMRFGLQRYARSDQGRLALEVDCVLRAYRGTGKLMTGATAVREELESVGRVRLVTLPVRFMAAKEDRFIRSLPQDLNEFALHEFGDRHPTLEQLIPPATVPGDPAWAETRGMFGFHESDPNGVVYTGDYIRRMLTHLGTSLLASDPSWQRWHVRRAQLLFKAPFRPGDTYAVRGRLNDWSPRGGSATLGIHSVRDGNADPRMAVAGVFDVAPWPE